jgi:heme A synthase
LIFTTSALLGVSFYLAVVCVNTFPSQEEREPLSSWIAPSVLLTLCFLVLQGLIHWWPGLQGLSRLVMLVLVWFVYQTDSLIETLAIVLLGGLIFSGMLYFFALSF